MTPKFFLILLVSLTLQLTLCEEDKRVITTLMHSRFYVKPTIVNGVPAKYGELPYLVSLKEPINVKYPGLKLWRNLCGGSIIRVSQVLTAAHCFESNKFYYAHNPRVLRIVAGNIANDLLHSGDTFSNELAQWRTIDKVLIHEHFSFPNNDLALVYINKKWIYSDGVDYIQPASMNTDYIGTCKAAGFGKLGHRFSAKFAPVLFLAPIDVMSTKLCSKMWEMDMSDYICSNSAWTDVAKGDSGGPLSCSDTTDPEEKSGRDLLVGVVSGKNFDKTTVFTRVSRYRDWIQQNRVYRVMFNSLYLLITIVILLYLSFLFRS